MYNVKKITTDILQVLIDSLNRDHITAQEELKAAIKKIIYNFNIKKYHMKKDLELKQQCIKLLEIRNIALNQIRNEKDEEMCQQCKTIESIKEECCRDKDKITKLRELLKEKQIKIQQETES